MAAQKPHVAILHYSAPPVVGGVEAVMHAHAEALRRHDYPVTVVAGRGEQSALPAGTRFEALPLLDSQHPAIVAASTALAQGRVPDEFGALQDAIGSALAPVLASADTVIVHNVFTKHFNLPLTAALFAALDGGHIGRCVAWSHDFTWTSPNSRSKVFPGHPWDLLRTDHPDVTHVVVSKQRRDTLAELYHCPPESIQVVYNGVDPTALWGLTAVGQELVRRLDLLSADIIMLMPVRVTQAKNIEFALDVVAALREREIDVKLVYTGPPDPHDADSMAYFRTLRARRDALGLGDQFHFVFESGPDDAPLLIDLDVVGDLYRVADVLFMPSHREGFGMPVLEAGLLGVPIVASTAVPAAVEINDDDMLLFDLDTPPDRLAQQIVAVVNGDRRLHLTQKVRRRLTWNAIFKHDIEPLLS